MAKKATNEKATGTGGTWNEESNLKFRDLANKRVAKALTAINSLKNLASPVYSKKPTEIEAIISALGESVETLGEAFAAGEKPKRSVGNLFE